VKKMFLIQKLAFFEQPPEPLRLFKFKNKAEDYARQLNYEERRREVLSIERMRLQREIYKYDNKKPHSYYNKMEQKEVFDKQYREAYQAFEKSDFKVPSRMKDITKYVVVGILYDDRPLVKDKLCY